jgi:2-polyprenyl-3-methyl-5-hydroxy-6-metoxy-1,4-benzoquinol methylase
MCSRRVLAVDASQEMVALARERLGDRAEVWCQDALDIALDEPVDVVVSMATLHWVTDHDRLWAAWLRRSGRAACSRLNAVDRATSIVSARSSTKSRASAHPSSSAGRPGSSQRRRKRKREAGFTLPLDYVRLNISAIRGHA